MRLEPLGNKVIVKRAEAEERTAAGIVLPDVAREKPRIGRVLSVGSGRQLDGGQRVPLQVKEGDRIVFAAWGGTEVEVDGEKLLILTEDDILAVIE
ncbi:MAG: 10 kDa chaperonin [Pirellulaceae bacterium]|nr:MAG: 10 kDa chaperonin [Pirellulaceae bacterium]